ncbi:MAG: recombinase family protein [Pseudomonadota bacterium]
MTAHSTLAAARARCTPKKRKGTARQRIAPVHTASDHAVAYVRVSSPTQVTRGHGLQSQETRCREYARMKGYEVKAVFRDDITGSLATRPGMQAMLAYLRRHRAEGVRVIIDDISRLARGLEAHLELRRSISAAGGVLESPSIEFGQDSDSILVENLLASVSQHQRQKNGEQVKNRMRARMLNGYWVFPAMAGYRFEKVPGHGKLLVRDEPVATVLQEAMEGFASGRFASLGAVKAYLNAHPDWPKPAAGEVHIQTLHYIFPRVLYAGYLDFPEWDISLVPGKHEPLIGFETWQRIVEKLEGNTHAPARADLHEDFPLRGAVACGCCGGLLTAGWSKGRSKRYAYYVCQARGCAMRGKSIRKAQIEGDFETLLRQMTPAPELMRIARAMLGDLWDARLGEAERAAAKAAGEIAAVEAKTAQVVERLIEADSPALVAAYEGQIVKLEEEKVRLVEKAAQTGPPPTTFATVSRTALAFLANPWKLWASGSLEHQRAVLRLAFTKPLPYCKNDGYRTADLSLPFKLLQGLKTQDLRMVEPRGVEPLTS